MKYILILILSFSVFGQEYVGYAKYKNYKSTASSTVSDAVFWMDVSSESASDKNLHDRAGSVGDMSPTNVTDAVYTNDPGWLDTSPASLQWITEAAQAPTLEFADQEFTAVVWVKMQNAGNLDLIGKRASTNDGPGWKIETQTTGFRLYLENDAGSNSGPTLTGIDDATESVFMVWVSRIGNTFTFKEEVTGTKTSVTVAWNLKDNGQWKIASVNSNFQTEKVGDVVIWGYGRTEDQMTEYYNEFKSEFGL